MNHKHIRDILIYVCIVLLVSLGVIFFSKAKKADTPTSTVSHVTTEATTQLSSDTSSYTETTTESEISSTYTSSVVNSIGKYVGSTKTTSSYATTANTTAQDETTTFIHPEQNSRYGTFSCRRLGINDLKVYYGDNEYCLSKGVGTSTRSALPGFGARTLFSAHNLTYFAPMKDVAVGDIFELNLDWGYYKYRVYKTVVMTPSEFDAGLIREPSDEIIVYTCYPFNGQSGSTHRIFMFCEMLEGSRMY